MIKKFRSSLLRWLVIWLVLTGITFFIKEAIFTNKWDFYPRWVGAQAMLRGENPYTYAVTQRIQVGQQGRILDPNEDQQSFAYIAIITWILLPFWALPFTLAASFWSALQLVIFIKLPRLFPHWHIEGRRAALVILFTVVLYRYALIGYFLEQFQAFVMACGVIAALALLRERPSLTAIMMVAMTIRPESILLLAFLGIELLRGRHYRAIALGAGLFLGLCLLTQIFIGPWIMDFVHGLKAYTEYSYPIWPPHYLGNDIAAGLLCIGIAVWGVWMLWSIWELPLEARLLWGLGVAVLVSQLLLTQTGIWTMVLTLLPIWVMVWSSQERFQTWLPMGIVLLLPWIVPAFLTDENADKFHQLGVPLLLTILYTGYFLRWRTASSHHVAENIPDKNEIPLTASNI